MRLRSRGDRAVELPGTLAAWRADDDVLGSHAERKGEARAPA